MTDGLPTVGVTNPDQIVDNARSARTPGVRLFTFGVGYDVNTALLDKLAAEMAAWLIMSSRKKTSKLKSQISLRRLIIQYLPICSSIWREWKPIWFIRATLPDLFRGSQITLIGRYRNPIDMDFVRLQLSGKTGGAQKNFFYNNLRFPLREDATIFCRGCGRRDESAG